MDELTTTTTAAQPMLPQAFVWRRIHSLTGLGLVIFLAFHLYVNSLATLAPADASRAFINSVNSLESTPFLLIVELLLLGVPFALHMVLGIKYLLTARLNSFGSDGSTPALPEYPRNRAYSWQRITSWLLLVGIVVHVVHMRFIERPQHTADGKPGSREQFVVSVAADPELYSLAEQLGVTVEPAAAAAAAGAGEKQQALAYADDFGTAELLMVRNAFKSPWILLLYTALVLSATFHAFNGLWTFMISWGVVILPRPQTIMRTICYTVMCAITFLGLAAIWGSFWLGK